MAAQPKLRALKTDAELKAIPTDQPVLIELPGVATNVEVDTERPAGEQQQRQAPANDGAQSLEQQLKAMKDARAADADRVAQSNRDRDAALARAAAAEAAGVDAEQRIATTGLAGAQADVAAAELAFQTAFEAGNGAEMAKAQSKIARGQAKVLQFEQDGAAAALRVEEAKRVPAAPQTVDPMVVMEQNAQLYPQEKAWFRQHPEAWSDRRMNIRLEDAYHRAMEKGITRGTDAYFTFVNEHMGYAAPAQQQQNGNGHDDGGHDYNGGSVMTAAPVSRQNGTMANPQQPQPGQVTLSPAEREIAANMGISEVAYAQNKVRMNDDKKARPEAYYVQR